VRGVSFSDRRDCADAPSPSGSWSWRTSGGRSERRANLVAPYPRPSKFICSPLLEF
jgi:hypothetical protein